MMLLPLLEQLKEPFRELHSYYEGARVKRVHELEAVATAASFKERPGRKQDIWCLGFGV